MAGASGKLSSQNLNDEIEILRSAIYHLSEGVIVADREGRFLICNQVARGALAPAAEENPPQSWSDVQGCYKPDGETLYAPDELPAALALAGKSVPETEIYLRNEKCPLGIWLATQAEPMRNGAGEIRGSIVVFRDISKKKEADTLIQTLTSAVEQTADSIIITDRSGLIEYVNPAFEQTTGYTRAEAEGRTPRILKSGVQDDAFYERLWNTILSGNVFRDTLANRKKNGEIFYAEQTITPMRGATGNITHFVTVIKDVTEQRKLQEQQFQMSLARTVQQQLYGISPPEVPDFDFAGASYPADATGGDYFDFVPLPGNYIGIVIGDVCGHGISSALLMAGLRAYLRAFAQKTPDAGEILTLTNQALVSDLEQNHYATLIFCCLDPSSGNLVYANAGHTPGYVLDSAGAVKRTLESMDIPLGFLPGHSFSRSDPFTLEPGEILALLTDGITDAERPDQSLFGVERALEFIKEHRRESAREIATGLYREVRDFSSGMPQTDDVTVIVCKATGRVK
jgi:PAS domain S-box-containing protein